VSATGTRFLPFKIILAILVRVADTCLVRLLNPLLADLGGGGQQRALKVNMKLLFPIAFGLIVFYCFAWPQFQAAQNHVARLVTVAVSR
jgi:hypothetical protein